MFMFIRYFSIIHKPHESFIVEHMKYFLDALTIDLTNNQNGHNPFSIKIRDYHNFFIPRSTMVTQQWSELCWGGWWYNGNPRLAWLCRVYCLSIGAHAHLTLAKSRNNKGERIREREYLVVLGLVRSWPCFLILSRGWAHRVGMTGRYDDGRGKRCSIALTMPPRLSAGTDTGLSVARSTDFAGTCAFLKSCIRRKEGFNFVDAMGRTYLKHYAKTTWP